MSSFFFTGFTAACGEGVAVAALVSATGAGIALAEGAAAGAAAVKVAAADEGVVTVRLLVVGAGLAAAILVALDFVVDLVAVFAAVETGAALVSIATSGTVAAGVASGAG